MNLPAGTKVRVKNDFPETRGPCHVRTPHYLRGRTGSVVRHLGRFPNPEDLAFGRPAAVQNLYHVRFDQTLPWGEGVAGDELLVELYEPWLEVLMIDLVPLDSPRLLGALRLLLAARGLASAEEIEQQIALTDAASPALGAAMVARAWVDPVFRARMLQNGSDAAESLGIPMPPAPPLGVLENAPNLHHLVVCTLCSCYPRAVLGYPPFWFKSAAYRARAVRDPRGLLQEFGTVLPDGVRVRVVDSTADYRWMVLPMRPAGTEHLDEPQLAGLVRAGDMIGVTVPHGPDGAG